MSNLCIITAWENVLSHCPLWYPSHTHTETHTITPNQGRSNNKAKNQSFKHPLEFSHPPSPFPPKLPWSDCCLWRGKIHLFFFNTHQKEVLTRLGVTKLEQACVKSNSRRKQLAATMLKKISLIYFYSWKVQAAW